MSTTSCRRGGTEVPIYRYHAVHRMIRVMVRYGITMHPQVRGGAAPHNTPYPVLRTLWRYYVGVHTQRALVVHRYAPYHRWCDILPKGLRYWISSPCDTTHCGCVVVSIGNLGVQGCTSRVSRAEGTSGTPPGPLWRVPPGTPRFINNKALARARSCYDRSAPRDTPKSMDLGSSGVLLG